jgi:uroporphyrinogen decarboxylase
MTTTTERSEGGAGKDWGAAPKCTAEPDFENLLAVLRCDRPARPTLFEFFLNERLHAKLAPPPENAPSNLDRLEPETRKGMKLIVNGPNVVLENVIRLIGFENLCLMTADDESLVSDIFEQVGSRIVRYYVRCLQHGVVGAVIGNDDWGFRSQTMLSPDDMRKFVFPWHRQIVAAAHAAGRPAILHSCGNLDEVLTDIIVDMQYDGEQCA